VKHGADIGSIAAYIAGGGLAGATAFAAVLDPKHALIYAAAMGAVISVAGLVRVITNPSPPAGTNLAVIPQGQVPATVLVNGSGVKGAAYSLVAPGSAGDVTAISPPTPKGPMP
jgi:hypothetical protein